MAVEFTVETRLVASPPRSEAGQSRLYHGPSLPQKDAQFSMLGQGQDMMVSEIFDFEAAGKNV
jgi:hypothetical protein